MIFIFWLNTDYKYYHFLNSGGSGSHTRCLQTTTSTTNYNNNNNIGSTERYDNLYIIEKLPVTQNACTEK